MKLGCIPAFSGRAFSGMAAARPVADALAAGAKDVAHRGTVPRDWLDTRGNAIRSIDVQGDAIFGRHAELIGTAKREVLIQTYALSPKSPGMARFIAPALRALEDRRRASGEQGPPIVVRILSNELGGLAARFMGKHGERDELSVKSVLGFEPDPRHLAVEIGVNRASTTNAIHTKCLVVDEARAMTCGANIQARNHPDPSDPAKVPQYDFGVSLEGPAVTSLREAFRSVWARASVHTPSGDVSTQPLAPSTRASAVEGEGARILTLTRRSQGIGSMFTRPFRRSTPQSRGMIGAIDRAERRISILTPNMNEPEVMKALVRAARRNVNVEIVLSKGFNDSREAKPLCGGTNDRTVDRLFARVPADAPLEIRWFTLSGADEPVAGQREGVGASHAKFLVVDGEIAFAGSANLDRQSWRFANETTLAIFDAPTARAMLGRVFDPVFERSVPAR